MPHGRWQKVIFTPSVTRVAVRFPVIGTPGVPDVEDLDQSSLWKLNGQATCM